MHVKRILILSDDSHTRAWLRTGLEDVDALVEEKPLADLRRAIMAGSTDLVIVDGGPGGPSSLLQKVEDAASAGIEICLLAVTEPAGLSSLRLPVRVPGDFVVRGASSDEIVARVRNLLWPGEDLGRDELVRVDNLTLNLATYQAQIDGQPIDFTYLEYALFSFLVTHPGRTHTREALLRRVWGTEYYGGSRTVDVHVRRIRSKIGAELSRHLETVRNVGYLWSA